MRSFSCRCGNTIYFENSVCVVCRSELGWCPGCESLSAIESVGGQEYRCGNAACGMMLYKCHNYEEHQVCNRCVRSATAEPAGLCNYCRFNDTIPDLTVPGNLAMWYRLETAKRRMFYTLDLLRLPYGNAEDGIEPELSFDFKGDIVKKSVWWWRMGKEERVYTGHASGKITINIREADHVEREKARVSFEEAHRTIIGHFRHEIGHYYWELLVQGKCEPEFKALFGDHNASYADAMQQHYENGPPEDWQFKYITSYASMHAWEDFAETFATYQDMVSVLDTAMHGRLGEHLDPRTAGLQEMVDRFVGLGVVLNEMNRAMGLIDLVPDIFAGPIVTKLGFVHDLLRAAARPVN